VRLVDRLPQATPERLIAELVPPPRFRGVRLDTYRPDPAQPSQAQAVTALREFAAGTNHSPDSGIGGRLRGLFGRLGPPESSGALPGVYLDGGFGVGKTHLLASLWHATEGRAAFGTFVEYTNLVGALGFRAAVTALSDFRLVCIDEFELDDPGDTVLMSRLLRELVDAGARLAATSNTLPGALGEGRFASDDFAREIQGLSARFRSVRIDGEDYRHRGRPEPPPMLPEEEVRAAADDRPGAALDDFAELLAHLAVVHPSRYGSLLDDVRTVCWTGVTPVPDQNVALRLVVLADRMYDRDLPLLASGEALGGLFGPEMLAGGYQKKYRRALSRLTALAREGEGIAPPGLG
jgi:cell division protein ZapE